MGADLRLSSGVLDELVAGFNGFAGQLSRACGDIRAGDSALTGEDPLAGQVHGFAGSWSYGLAQLGRHGTDCAALLRRVGATFGQLDGQLAAGLPVTKAQR